MIDVRKDIVSLLRQRGLKPYFVEIPAGSELPCMVYSEVDNRDYLVVSNNEYASIVYNFAIYAMDPVDIFDMAKTLDSAMKEIGFNKTFTSNDQKIDGVYLKTYRYGATINHKKQVFKY